ncbi:MAG TPA: Ig-like domain-containing domain [Bacteroidales bacterium]|nr:Ig-like domain-containing domain [Bacteroidales bacterium]
MSRRIYLYLIGLLMVVACAKIGAPSGGKKDILPPVVVESSPVNGAKNFMGKEIKIEFNEYVTLSSINEKLMVSPPLKKKPSVSLRGKSIIIKYEDQLKDSTTYSFYFQDAIRDLNESNILEDYKFVFSTGSVIDSLSVTGNVYVAKDLEIPENTSVLLYSDLSDSAVVKALPDYISKVNSDGYFRIDNARKGNYRLFALTDDDNSKNYNRIEESFAFLDSVIAVTPEKNYIKNVPDSIRVPVAVVAQKTQNTGVNNSEEQKLPKQREGNYKLYLYTSPTRNRYLINSSRDTKYKLTYALSIPPDTMDFNVSIIDAPENSYLIKESSQRDTAIVWLTDSTVYSKDVINTIVEYPYTDSLGTDTYRTDTIAMRFITPKTRAAKTKPKLMLRNNIASSVIKPGQKVVFTSETPLKEPDTTLIDLFRMKDKEKYKIPFSFEKDTVRPGKLTLNARLEEGIQYQLITDSASISDIYNSTIDSASIVFTVKEAKAYGSIVLTVSNCKSNCIILLLDNSEKVKAEKSVSSDGIVEFKLLDSGSYRLKVIYDLNNDGRWTTGDYFTGRQPEPVSYFPKELSLPESWEAKESWDLGRRNVKEQNLRKASTKATNQ